jgi:hypothetical protein
LNLYKNSPPNKYELLLFNLCKTLLQTSINSCLWTSIPNKYELLSLNQYKIGEFYTGSNVGVHTCWRRVLYWFKGRSSYLFGDEYCTGSKVGIHTYLGKILYWFKDRSSYLFGKTFLQTSMNSCFWTSIKLFPNEYELLPLNQYKIVPT